MATRPMFVDLRSKSQETMNSGTQSPRVPAMPSSRLQHFAGDIPPAMSPLDMFAMQSRILAKQLDDSKRNGRRVSRLPPLTTGDPITKQQSMYDRSRSAETKIKSPAGSPRAREEDIPGTMPEVEEPAFRPKSFYPRMSGLPPVEGDQRQDVITQSPDLPFITPAEFHSPAVRSNDYFGVPRARSPEPVAPPKKNPATTEQAPWLYSQPNREISQQMNEPQRELSIESTSTRSNNGSLAPPMSPHIRQAASIRSVPQDSSDDELSASTGGSGFSQHRKLSSSSGVSMPHSPFSHFTQTHVRSPSLNSEYSLGGSRQNRAPFNFSRPLSRQSQQMDTTSRQPSFDSRPSMDAVRLPFGLISRQSSSDSRRALFDDGTVQIPVSIDSEQFQDMRDNPEAPAPSYIYAKFSLPRGRMLQRDSHALDHRQSPLPEWEAPVFSRNIRPTTPLANKPMTPNLSPPSSPKPSVELHRSSPRPSAEHRSYFPHRPSHEQTSRSSPRPSYEQSSRDLPPTSFEKIRQVSNESRPSIEQRHIVQNKSPPTPVQNDDHSVSDYSASTRSGSTIKAGTRSRLPAPSVELTAEDHLAKGIELHERGAARESTYHLRIAARQNLPTAMLLYALACRHGWGMRPNPQEGVQWLRKAADCAQVEIAVDEDVQGKPADVSERKTKRAQFALSIYELGVSHMNGWGLEQDKTLALRCFEIAANWGDADAMAEAGFCYAQGQGCKKDLKKAAKYYRMAEAKGMSMVGNSW